MKSTLIHAMERDAEDVLYALRLTDAEMGNPGSIKTKFKYHSSRPHFIRESQIHYAKARGTRERGNLY